jgi:hypothetical protein
MINYIFDDLKILIKFIKLEKIFVILFNFGNGAFSFKILLKKH